MDYQKALKEMYDLGVDHGKALALKEWEIKQLEMEIAELQRSAPPNKESGAEQRTKLKQLFNEGE